MAIAKRISLFLMINFLVIFSLLAVCSIITMFLPPEFFSNDLEIVTLGFGGAVISLLMLKFMAKKLYRVQIIDGSVPLSLFLMINFLVIFSLLAVCSTIAMFLPPEFFSNDLGIVTLGFGGAVISLLMSKFMAKKLYRVQIIDGSVPQHGWIVETTHRLAKKAGLKKMPEVSYYENLEVNAFATGPSKNNSLVAVSTGLLHHMNKDEAEGVLGHEIAHIANGDMVTMMVVQGVVNGLVISTADMVINILACLRA